MLADQGAVTGQLLRGARSRTRAEQRATRGRATARGAAFVGATGLVLVYALRGGGSYDSVTFEESGLVIWWIVATGIALGLLPRSRPSRPVLLMFGALLAYAAWTALSLTWTDSSELTFKEVARSLDYLGLVALPLCLLDRDTWRSAVAGLGIGALLVCLIAVGGRLDPSIFGHDRIDATIHTDRLSYPFGYWNAMVAWGAMCVALALTWSAHDGSRVRRAVALALVPTAATMIYLTYSRAGVGGASLAVLAMLVFSRNRVTGLAHTAAAAAGSTVVILAVRGSPQIAHGTGTRGAGQVFGTLVLAGALCAATAVATSRWRVDRWRMPRQFVRWLAVACAIVMVVAIAAVGPRVASHAWRSFKRVPTVQIDASATARLSNLSGTRYPVWTSALKAFSAHPVGGTGAGTFEFWWSEHGANALFLRDAHSIWLENMAELGLPGLLLIVTFVASALWVGVSARRRARRTYSAGATAAVLAAFVVYLMHASVDWMWQSTAVSAFALTGIAALGARLAQRRLRLALPVRAALSLAAVTVALLQLPGILSTTDIRRSQAAERVGDPSRALALASDAINAEPWSASAYEQRGLVLESAGRLGQAADDLSRAIQREPNNDEHWLVRARIETEQARLRAAVADYERARELRPRSSVFQLAPYFKVPSKVIRAADSASVIG